jgi:RNA polymerase sigma factor (sigma-70 family)
MPSVRLSAAVARVGRAALSPDRDATDGGLLARYVRDRDGAAFAELVRRLGPMVLGVCRRVTADAHLAEDAFQAAFLVLARRAADVRPRESVRGWLYGVAARTAQKARVMSARRRAREVPVAALPDCSAPARGEPDSEILRALDEEVAALPDHLRAAVVLCELDGLARRDAAARLGIAEGTLSSRLAKARHVLADRLRKRGVALGASGLGCALGQLASAAVPPRLASATAALADGSAPVPASVAALSQGVLRTMFIQKLAAGAACGLLIAVACLAARAALPEAAAQEPAKRPAVPLALVAKPADDKPPLPAAKPAGPGTLLLARENDLVALTPDGKGKEGGELTPPKDSRSCFHGRLSPDGTRAAFVVNTGKLRGPNDNLDDPWPFQVVVHKFGAADPTAVVDFATKGWFSLCWAPDGKKILVTNETGGGTLENVLVDPETGKTEAIELPAKVQVLDWSRDGKTFLVLYHKDKKFRIGLAAKGDKEVRELTELKVRLGGGVAGRFSPDGTKVLFTDADPEDKDAFKWHQSSKPHVLDVATKKREPVAEYPENAQCTGVAWSPDGKRIAYTWRQLHPDLLKMDSLNINDAQVETEAFLIVADASGKNAKTVASAKAGNAVNQIYGSIDWR